MLTIEVPSNCDTERIYITGVIIEDWLGLPWSLVKNDRKDIRISLHGQPGELILPNAFFSKQEKNWLTEFGLPKMPLPMWNTYDLSKDILIKDPLIPVIYGDAKPCVSIGNSVIRLPIDIFGSAFFMLSRYEEAVLPDRDCHDRFPAIASFAYREDFLDRPIIDEYVEILWVAMKKLWPGLKRKPRTARTLVSCDVDSPFYYDGSLLAMTRCFAGDILKRRSPMLALQNLLGNLEARQSKHSKDPHRKGLDLIMDLNEGAGRKAAFYMMAIKTDAILDSLVSIDHPLMWELIFNIHMRGHEIGIHPGYNTYKDPETFRSSVQALRDKMAEMSVKQNILGGRQHFLRWDALITAKLWDECGLDYDSTLGYADRPGFRCGTCHEYPLYDLVNRRPLSVIERPLIVMDCSVIEERYMGLGFSGAALDMMKELKNTCHLFGGDFNLLWHNTYFDSDKAIDIYKNLVL